MSIIDYLDAVAAADDHTGAVISYVRDVTATVTGHGPWWM